MFCTFQSMYLGHQCPAKHRPDTLLVVFLHQLTQLHTYSLVYAIAIVPLYVIIQHLKLYSCYILRFIKTETKGNGENWTEWKGKHKPIRERPTINSCHVWGSDSVSTIHGDTTTTTTTTNTANNNIDTTMTIRPTSHLPEIYTIFWRMLRDFPVSLDKRLDITHTYFSYAF
jgi:hypothetical protein